MILLSSNLATHAMKHVIIIILNKIDYFDFSKYNFYLKKSITWI